MDKRIHCFTGILLVLALITLAPFVRADDQDPALQDTIFDGKGNSNPPPPPKPTNKYPPPAQPPAGQTDHNTDNPPPPPATSNPPPGNNTGNNTGNNNNNPPPAPPPQRVAHHVANIRPKSAPAIPDGVAQEAAETRLHDLFKPDYLDHSASGMDSLAQKLIDTAQGTNDAALKFVALRDARDLAARSGDADAALRSSDLLAAAFRLDPLGEREVACAKLCGAANTPAGVSAAVAISMNLADECIEADNFPVAFAVLHVAEAVVRDDHASAARVAARLAEGRDIQVEYQRMNNAPKTLAVNPNDWNANFEVGRYLCYGKGEWDKGLPLLRKGSNEKLRALAMAELIRPTQPAEMAKVADAWWEESTLNTGIAKTRLQDRAVMWSRLALEGEGLSAAEKARLQARVDVYGGGLDAQMNNVADWTVVSGNWAATPQGIVGSGDSIMKFNGALPPNFSLSFNMTVLDGHSPRIHFAGTGLYIATGPSTQCLMLYQEGPGGGTPQGFAVAYDVGKTIVMRMVFAGGTFELWANDKLIASGKRAVPPSVLVDISGGGQSGEGRTMYSAFHVSGPK